MRVNENEAKIPTKEELDRQWAKLYVKELEEVFALRHRIECGMDLQDNYGLEYCEMKLTAREMQYIAFALSHYSWLLKNKIGGRNMYA